MVFHRISRDFKGTTRYFKVLQGYFRDFKRFQVISCDFMWIHVISYDFMISKGVLGKVSKKKKKKIVEFSTKGGGVRMGRFSTKKEKKIKKNAKMIRMV